MLGCTVVIEWLLSIGLYCDDRVVAEHRVVSCTVMIEWLLSVGLYCDDKAVTYHWVVLWQ